MFSSIKKIEVVEILQESTSGSDSLGEVEIKSSCVHFFDNPFSYQEHGEMAQ